MKRFCLSIAATLAAVSATRAQDVVALPDIDITVEAPVAAPVAASSDTFINNTPSDSTRVGAATIARTASPNISDTLQRVVPGVTIQGTSGNSFQPDVEYRGFVASPVSGTPQGLAVYQNGVRINEAFGDTMNWDMIPTFAIASMDLISNNPAFGLNALGGALNIRMKDGFTFQGGKLDVSGGSFGRIQAGFEYGKQVDHFAFYGAIEAAHDDGYRNLSASTLRRFYGDLGYRAEGNEIHLSLGLADNLFGATGPAPIELIDQNWANVYTTPQTSHNQMGMATLSGKFELAPTWSLTAAAYVRRFVQHTVDGNPTNVQACADPTLLCYGNGNGTLSPANGLNGQQLNNTFPAGAVLGEIDRTSVLTTSLGTSFLLSNSDTLFGYKNHASFGASFDYGMTNFGASAELGVIQPNYVIAGSGTFLGTSGSPATDGPVSINSYNRYLGVNALDAFDVSDKLTLSGGARLNLASISLFDQLGGGVNGEHEYVHVNPVVGLTWKITPELQAYGSYAESNRAPTPLELGCANPNQPCILASFLVSDPSLKQVVARTYEAGLRGQHDLANDWGSLGWKLGAFRTLSQNDIMNLPAPNQQGFGYFANVGDTQRQGVETSFNYKKGPVTVHASYAYIDATFRTAIQLASNSPSADPVTGLINVVPGDQMPMIPRHRAKLGIDWDVSSKAKLGADLLFTGPQRYAGDASNQQPMLPAYFTVSLNGSYKLSDEIELYGRIDNLLNRRYYTYGTFFETNSIFNAFTDARSVTPAQPLSVYAGLRYRFDEPVAAPTQVAEKY